MKKRNRIIKAIAIAALCFVQSIWAQKVWSGKIDSEWYWNNTSQTEFTITTAEQLAGLAQLVNGGNDFSGKTIKLGANIVLNDTVSWHLWGQTQPLNNRMSGSAGYDTTKPTNIWTPIGLYEGEGKNSNRPFSGTFDGGNYIVSGIYTSTSNDYQGLFGYATSSVTIRNFGVTASFINRGGGLVGRNEGTITDSYATGNVRYGGGLAKENKGTITNSYATGNVNDGGGLVEKNEGGTITNCYATGNVKGGGGLVNENEGTIMNCYATGNVKSGGGLVRSNKGGTITNCYATGNVKNGGGLVEENSSRKVIIDCMPSHALGPCEIKGSTITNSYATGNVSGGGLVEKNFKGSTITNSYATGNMTHGGGLVRENSGTITDSYAAGNVNTRGGYNGGLVGRNSGIITNCNAMGNVNGNGKEDFIGGLVGYNLWGGTITNSYATGDVSGGTVGGLVGSNESEGSNTITNCYAMGNVNGSTVGGLVGKNKGSTITNCYAIGSVSGSGTSVGGLVGSEAPSEGHRVVYNPKTINSYYNRQTSGQSDIVKGEPKSTAEMKQESTFEGWDFGNIWMINADKNNGYPYLQSSKNLTEPIKYKYTHKVQEGKVLADKRDGKKYKTVIIGTQTWMAENLNYNAKGSKCYRNDPTYCKNYGRLYDWTTAMKSCPSGWHLPTIMEWYELYRYVDDLEGDVESNLRAKDKFGFSAVSAGYVNPYGDFSNSFGNWWWSASENLTLCNNCSTNLLYMGDKTSGKSNLISVRCLQN